MNDINTKTYDSDKILQLLPAPEGMFFAYEDDGKAHPVSCLALVELSNGDREVKAMGLMNCGVFEEITGAALFHEFPQTANQQTAGDKFLQIIPAPAGARYRFPEDGEKVHPAACLALGSLYELAHRPSEGVEYSGHLYRGLSPVLVRGDV